MPPETRSSCFRESMRAFRKRVSGFLTRFVENQGVGGAPPEMRSRNRVGGPATRDLLLNLIVARGCEKAGVGEEWRWADWGLFCCGKKYFESWLLGMRRCGVLG